METLLRVRKARRDQIRGIIARILVEQRQFEAEKTRFVEMQLLATEELRRASAGGRLDIDRLAGLRQHSAVLTLGRAELDRRASGLHERLARAQALLAEAESRTKVIEKLCESQRLELQRQSLLRDDREATDRYAAQMIRSQFASGEHSPSTDAIASQANVRPHRS